MNIFLLSCTSLTYQERQTVRSLKSYGINVSTPLGNWEKPVQPAVAAFLNLLPGGGNFYLASGNAGEDGQYVVGVLNLLTWPISILWGIPEAAIDANRINERELVYYYTFDETGKQTLKDKKLFIDSRGFVANITENPTE